MQKRFLHLITLVRYVSKAFLSEINQGKTFSRMRSFRVVVVLHLFFATFPNLGFPDFKSKPPNVCMYRNT